MIWMRMVEADDLNALFTRHAHGLNQGFGSNGIGFIGIFMHIPADQGVDHGSDIANFFSQQDATTFQRIGLLTMAANRMINGMWNLQHSGCNYCRESVY